MNTPTKYDDVIDSRDVIARIEELQSEREALEDARVSASEDVQIAAFNVEHWSGKDCGDFGGWDGLIEFTTEYADSTEEQKTVYELKEALEAEEEAAQALKEWDDENAEELKELTDLASEGEDYSSDWKYGETLIRDSYFRDYAQELAEELDLVKPEVNWPYTCIDWDRAARELQYDYSLISFGGIDYWIRSC